MQIHELRPAHKLKKKKRIGRGGKRGTYSGRGQKGQRSRAGAKIKPMERELILRIPKMRGLGFQRPRRTIKLVTVSLQAIEKHFQEGETVSPMTLLKKGLVERERGRIPAVKILGPGPISKRLVFRDCIFSESARKAIQDFGGTIA
jgi:large subunit ribosomal protein L15